MHTFDSNRLLLSSPSTTSTVSSPLTHFRYLILRSTIVASMDLYTVLSTGLRTNIWSSLFQKQETGWPFQLLSVACLSLAAKMEELYVPWLLDLQMLEPTYVFEPKTIQRMELLVLATLKWRLRSVTPFDFLHYFISMLPSSASTPDSVSTLHSLASNIILNTTRGKTLSN